MPAKKRRNKPYTPKPVRVPKMMLCQSDFQQVDSLISMLENGEVLEAQGNVVMYSMEGELYQVAPALETWCDYWQKIADINNITLDDAPLRTLINKVNCNIQITLDMVKKAKSVVHIQRQLFMATDHNVISQVAIAHQASL